MADLTDFDASELRTMLDLRETSCRELMQAVLARIHRLNPAYNAIVNLAPDDVLLAQADQYDKELQRDERRGWLHGIPVAIKDAADAVGFPTTRGCELLAKHMPRSDSIMTARMKAAGCIVIGKTTTPELGLGSHTFSTLFGPTRNAWDPAVSAGGSSGGAAVALAQRMVPIADGSDFMGSLRNPAGWNHVYGMRPTQGRVPQGNNPDIFIDLLSTEGPMGRSLRDVWNLLRTQAGHDPRAPMSLQSEVDAPLESLRDISGLRIGWLGDLGGYLPVEPGILEACREGLRTFEQVGFQVEDAALGFDCEKLWACWLTWRRAIAGPRVGALMGLPGAKEKIKPEAQWEYECSLGLSYMDFRQASAVRSSYYQHMRQLFGRYDILVLPSAQCWPFPVEWRWPQEVAGRRMDTYHRWMEVTIYATLASCPSLVVPAGFHPDRQWPIGMQLIGPYGADAFLLDIATLYEGTREEFLSRRPPQ